MLIDPEDSNVVYVAALGHQYTYNEERGVFKTTDGGDTWSKVLFVDTVTGIIDLLLKDAQGNIIPVWRAIWPVFGATNQLLGALALLTVGVWLKRTGRRTVFVVVPMIFIFGVTLVALGMLVWENDFLVIRAIAGLLFLLAIVLIVEAVRALDGDLVVEDEDLPDEGPTVTAGGKVC